MVSPIRPIYLALPQPHEEPLPRVAAVAVEVLCQEQGGAGALQGRVRERLLNTLAGHVPPALESLSL
eukprot:4481082-Pyramimonas_sp.AAC.1